LVEVREVKDACFPFFDLLATFVFGTLDCLSAKPMFSAGHARVEHGSEHHGDVAVCENLRTIDIVDVVRLVDGLKARRAY
jgi:hypothetical protein